MWNLCSGSITEFLIPADPPGGNNENDLWHKNTYFVLFFAARARSSRRFLSAIDGNGRLRM